MKVRHSCSRVSKRCKSVSFGFTPSKGPAISGGERLFGRDQGRADRALVHLFGDDLADGAAAFSALELAPVMRLHGFGAAGPGVDGGPDALAVDTVADTDDHENHLHDTANDCQSGFCALLQKRNGRRA
tara:strand:- start:1642 stop:2028 length:387 start_codon:yes stop_codon:yes gene_type:complete